MDKVTMIVKISEDVRAQARIQALLKKITLAEYISDLITADVAKLNDKE